MHIGQGGNLTAAIKALEDLRKERVQNSNKLKKRRKLVEAGRTFRL